MIILQTIRSINEVEKCKLTMLAYMSYDAIIHANTDPTYL